MKKLNITFIDTTEFNLEPPKPAKHILPKWYKDLPAYIGEHGKKPLPEPMGPSTAKKCLVVFDSMTAGYLITSPVDVYVVNDGQSIEYQYPALNYMTYHREAQVTNYPNSHGTDIPKFVTPWGIKTPKGYSCLFIPPAHRDNVVNILPAVIDTDTFHLPVEFPFTLNNIGFSGLIPKGTPIAQVIPFKRESWTHSVSHTKEDMALMERLGFELKSLFFDKYKKLYWDPKHYD
jgi:hypothetical protein